MKMHTAKIFLYTVVIPLLVLIALLWMWPARNSGQRVGEVSTTWRMLSPNNKIIVTRFDDSEIDGASCWLSRAQTGGWSGAAGVAEDPSNMSISCAQTGPLKLHDTARSLNDQTVFTERASILLKTIAVHRYVDDRGVCYLVTSTKVVEGSPFNSVSCISLTH